MFDDLNLNPGSNGGKLPLERKVLKRPLSHEEMDYNMRLINNIVDDYPILGSGTEGELTSADLNKALILTEIEGNWFWVPGEASGGGGGTGAQGAQGGDGAKGDPGVQGAQGAPGLQGAQGAQGAKGDSPTSSSLMNYDYEIDTPTGAPTVNPTAETISFNTNSGELWVPYEDVDSVDHSRRLELLLSQDTFDLDITNPATPSTYDHIEVVGAFVQTVNLGGTWYFQILVANINGVAVSNPDPNAVGDINYSGFHTTNMNHPSRRVELDKWGASSGAGTEGAQGAQGAQGDPGAEGAQGDPGTGAQGAQGDPGTGTEGAQGAQGDPGTGTEGAQGAQGDPGTGAQGDPGTEGAQGAQGDTGTGTQGAQGAQGAPGTGSTSGPGVYVVKLQFSTGSLISSPFVAAEDPAGNDLLNDPNWTFTRDGNNEITIVHPESKFGNDFNTHSDRGENQYLTKAISGASLTLNSVLQDSVNKDSINIKALTTTQTGLTTGGTYMYITWTFADNDFVI